ncbi:hypothetical protein [Paracoccus xiamenensis]|uniref:hypothetical protein n=1 Tax=Paracoccus xiamenensis TaxID=2714901 RepID=UPI001407EEF6|nr:hypothetical protein [Paracoccus xiamenensis]NHF74687.1 hypothetical protein [Paracoccus xiamenensis]
MSDFESFGLKAGVWAGLLRRPTAPKRVLLVHLAAPVAEAKIRADQPGTWRIEVALPADCLADGVQSFALLADEGEGDAPLPGAERLATLSLVAGTPLDMDLRAEIDLIRAELDLLKHEFRRIATE